MQTPKTANQTGKLSDATYVRGILSTLRTPEASDYVV